MTDIPKEFVQDDGVESHDQDDEEASEDLDNVNSEYVMRLRSRHQLSGCVTSMHSVPAKVVENRNATDSDCLLLALGHGKVRTLAGLPDNCLKSVSSLLCKYFCIIITINLSCAVSIQLADHWFVDEDIVPVDSFFGTPVSLANIATWSKAR